MGRFKSHLTPRFTARNIILCLSGSLVYCLALNILITPAKLYAGGFTGISQLIAGAVGSKVHLKFNLQALIYFLLDVPLFLAGAKTLGKRMVARSFLIVSAETVFMALIPIPEHPVVDETFAAVMLGGSLEGIGSALTFSGFGSSGGTDMLGLILTQKFRKMSVGRVSLAVNAVVYTIAGVYFSLQTALYSLVAEVFCSMMIDRYHKQNNLVCVNIISGRYQMFCKYIIDQLDRGATILEAEGAYTGSERKVVIAIVSEYELELLKKEGETIDPDAFIYIQPSTEVLGEFQKRLS